jgi:hypothetical protein
VNNKSKIQTGFLTAAVLNLCLTVYGADNNSMPAVDLTATPTAVFTPILTPTPMPSISIMGTVNYQGQCLNNIYVFMTDNNGGYYLSLPLTNKAFYSFVESPLSVQGFVLWVCYDSTGNGIQLTPNYNGYGYPVQQGNGAPIENSGDVVCNVGYFGSCMAIGPGGGTHYTSNQTVNIVFGGKTGLQSGSSCSN